MFQRSKGRPTKATNQLDRFTTSGGTNLSIISLGLAFVLGGSVGYIVGTFGLDNPVSGSYTSILCSSVPNKVHNQSAPVAFATGDAKVDDGWKLLHIFTGGKSDHLEILLPMAQANQDKLVAGMLRQKRGGYFLELGANDATYLSNTYTLEKDYDWTGLCIEPNPQYWHRLSYRKCDVVAAVVGKTPFQEVRFDYTNDGALGRIVDNKMNVKQKTTPYYTVTLEHMLRHVNAPTILDYLSLDVEGAEFDVLQYFPFDHYSFRIMTVERPNSNLISLLQQKGYVKLCDIAHFGETLWVYEQEKINLDLSILPTNCQGRAGT